MKSLRNQPVDVNRSSFSTYDSIAPRITAKSWPLTNDSYPPLFVSKKTIVAWNWPPFNFRLLVWVPSRRRRWRRPALPFWNRNTKISGLHDELMNSLL